MGKPLHILIRWLGRSTLPHGCRHSAYSGLRRQFGDRHLLIYAEFPHPLGVEDLYVCGTHVPIISYRGWNVKRSIALYTEGVVWYNECMGNGEVNTKQALEIIRLRSIDPRKWTFEKLGERVGVSSEGARRIWGCAQRLEQYWREEWRNET